MLEDLNNRINDNLESLEDKYGPEVIKGMADTYLTEEEQIGLKTDEDRMQVMVNKMVGDDGKIKSEYAHLDQREIEVLQDWYEREQLKLEARSINRDVERNNGVTQEIRDNAADITADTNSSGRHALVKTLESVETKNIVVEADISDASEISKSGVIGVSISGL